MDNAGKFTGRAAVYAQGRPGYPVALFDLLTEEVCGEGCRMADVGSGTGILSRALLDRGWTVYGVEPNEDMRHEAERALGGFPRFHSVAGTAEQTGLADGSVDVVTAAQAFHWFDAEAFGRECRRILTPGGQVVLIWNSRREDSPAVQEEGRIHRAYCPAFRGFSGGMPDMEETIGAFFKRRFRVCRFSHELSYTREQYVRRMLSSSYSLGENEENRHVWLEELNGLFERFQSDGKIEIPNETITYMGALSSSPGPLITGMGNSR